jgi:hypothetical protein
MVDVPDIPASSVCWYNIILPSDWLDNWPCMLLVGWENDLHVLGSGSKRSDTECSQTGLAVPLSIHMLITFYPILYVAFSNIAISGCHLLEKERPIFYCQTRVLLFGALTTGFEQSTRNAERQPIKQAIMIGTSADIFSDVSSSNITIHLGGCQHSIIQREVTRTPSASVLHTSGCNSLGPPPNSVETRYNVELEKQYGDLLNPL